jgi:hypothetical protein
MGRGVLMSVVSVDVDALRQVIADLRVARDHSSGAATDLRNKVAEANA